MSELDQQVMTREQAERFTEQFRCAMQEYVGALQEMSDLRRRHPEQFEDNAPVTPERSVYFIRAGDVGPIKVGSAANPVARLAELQTASPFPLTLLGTIPGGYEEERRIHRMLDPARTHGEWFEPTPEVIDYINMRMI